MSVLLRIMSYVFTNLIYYLFLTEIKLASASCSPTNGEYLQEAAYFDIIDDARGFMMMDGKLFLFVEMKC